MCMITFSLKMFTFAGIIGIFVLLPVNCWGNQLQDIDIADFVNNSLDVFTISNEYIYISSRRISYFYSSEPQPHHFTILVRSIPTSSSGNISDNVQSFFSELYPSTYLSHVVVH
ncbi:hypothetical protein JHK85_000526 [Glycine max]|nr:hypothetical protein JHK85_000526 [Glycine max]KAG5087904.1 hypothetical protein JHK86_000516 [Glycine max]